MMTKFAWWALALSIVLHLATVLAEPLVQWLSFRAVDDPELKKTERKLAAQTVDSNDLAAELAGVKPVDEQYVLLQAAVPLITTRAEPAPSKPKVRASSVKASKASAIMVASAPAVSPAQEAASQVASVVAATASVASSVLPSKLANSASKASKVASVATKIDRAAAKRFPRDVKIEYRYMGFPAYLQWKLQANRYELQLDVPIPGNARRFISTGKIDRHGVMPEQFIEYRKKFDLPRYDVRFDWETEQVTLIEGANQKTEPFAAGDQDLMSAALHLALMGGSQAKYDMALFSGRKRYPNVQFELKGEANLKIGGKEMPALLMGSRTGERQVDFWLAPDWHNLPVRMVINFAKDGSYDLSAYNITLDGEKVLEWVNPNTQASQNRRP